MRRLGSHPPARPSVSLAPSHPLRYTHSSDLSLRGVVALCVRDLPRRYPTATRLPTGQVWGPMMPCCPCMHALAPCAWTCCWLCVCNAGCACRCILAFARVRVHACIHAWCWCASHAHYARACVHTGAWAVSGNDLPLDGLQVLPFGCGACTCRTSANAKHDFQCLGLGTVGPLHGGLLAIQCVPK